jgi:hypothetical protein
LGSCAVSDAPEHSSRAKPNKHARATNGPLAALCFAGPGGCHRVWRRGAVHCAHRRVRHNHSARPLEDDAAGAFALPARPPALRGPTCRQAPGRLRWGPGRRGEVPPPPGAGPERTCLCVSFLSQVRVKRRISSRAEADEEDLT